MTVHLIQFSLKAEDIDKALMIPGKTGTWIPCTMRYDDANEDQYGNHSMITQSVSKESRESGERGPILGNGKCVWKGESRGNSGQPAPSATQQPADSDIPF